MPDRSGEPHKVLILYENGCGGPRAMALALAEAFAALPEVDAAVLCVDEVVPPVRKRLYMMSIEIRLRLRPLVRFAYRWAVRPNALLRLLRRLNAPLQAWGLRRLLPVIAERAPDLIVTTHYRPLLACSTWLGRGVLRTPVHAVVGDFVAHGLWAARAIERYYVATEAAKEDLTGNGVPAARVAVTGIPIGPAFASADAGSPGDARRALGLQPERPLVLLMGGARGDQDYDALLRHLDACGLDVQVAVICGWNEALKQELTALAGRLQRPVSVRGFETNMLGWYRAADVIVTKPGALTTSEALALLRPLVFLAPHPGIEELQAAWLARAGTAIYAASAAEAIQAVQRILREPARQRRMAEAAAALRRPGAAAAIARAATGSRER